MREPSFDLSPRCSRGCGVRTGLAQVWFRPRSRLSSKQHGAVISAAAMRGEARAQLRENEPGVIRVVAEQRVK